jgi:hypothetical protein
MKNSNLLKISFIFVLLFIFALFFSSCNLFYPYIGEWEGIGSYSGNNYRFNFKIRLDNYVIEIYKNGALYSGEKGYHDLERNGNYYESKFRAYEKFVNGSWVSSTDEYDVRIQLSDDKTKLYFYVKAGSDYISATVSYGIQYLVKK